MMTRLSEFFAVLAANRGGFTAKSRGDRKGTIRRGGDTPADVVYLVVTGHRAETTYTAARRLFQSDRRRMLITAAAEAPSLLYIYQRVFASTWQSFGESAALKIQDEWQAILGVRGQMLKSLGIKDPLRGADRLPVHLLKVKKEGDA